MKLRILWRVAACIALAAPIVVGPANGAETTKQKKRGDTHARHRAEEDEAAKAARARALEDGWPDTPAGMIASGWVGAFDEGEDAIRAFLEKHLTAAALKERPMDQRIESYLALRERFGDLMLKSVAESAPEELTVVLLAEDASPYHFVFTVEKEAPHRLVKVAILQPHGHGGHGTH